jgi:hypothetical protein
MALPHPTVELPPFQTDTGKKSPTMPAISTAVPIKRLRNRLFTLASAIEWYVVRSTCVDAALIQARGLAAAPTVVFATILSLRRGWKLANADGEFTDEAATGPQIPADLGHGLEGLVGLRAVEQQGVVASRCRDTAC